MRRTDATPPPSDADGTDSHTASTAAGATADVEPAPATEPGSVVPAAESSELPRLTPRQRAVLDVISQSLEARGYPPSVREIGDSVGLSSSSSVFSQLRSLEKKGYLRRDANRPRAVEVTRLHDQSTDLTVPAPADPEPLSPTTPTVAVPLLGSIAAGTPILAEQATDEVFGLPRQLVGEGTCFMLRVRGESMIDAAICDGDFVVIRQQPSAENGEIVAALIDDEATVKVLQRRNGQVWLLPCNESFAPIDGTHATILGKVVSVLRRV